MSRAMRAAVLAMSVLLLFAAAVTVSVVYEQHEWCATLDLLTSQPAAPPASSTAARAEARKLYEDFEHLRDRFGC